MISFVLFLLATLALLSSANEYTTNGLLSAFIYPSVDLIVFGLIVIFGVYCYCNTPKKAYSTLSLICATIGIILSLLNSFFTLSPFYESAIYSAYLSFPVFLVHKPKLKKILVRTLSYLICLNFLVALSQHLAGYHGFKDVLLFGVALMTDETGSIFANLGRSQGLFLTPFSLATFAILASSLLSIHSNKSPILHLLCFLSLLLSLSRAYVLGVLSILLLYAINYFIKVVFLKYSRTLSIIFAAFSASLALYAYQISVNSDSIFYKVSLIPIYINIFLSRPLTIIFGFSNDDYRLFKASLDPQMLAISDSLESWVIRLIVFGGIFLLLAYIISIIFSFQILPSMTSNYRFAFYLISVGFIGSLVSNGGYGGFNSILYFISMGYLCSFRLITPTND